MEERGGTEGKKEETGDEGEEREVKGVQVGER